jgi:hypothetical protein
MRDVIIDERDGNCASGRLRAATHRLCQGRGIASAPRTANQHKEFLQSDEFLQEIYAKSILRSRHIRSVRFHARLGNIKTDILIFVG